MPGDERHIEKEEKKQAKLPYRLFREEEKKTFLFLDFVLSRKVEHVISPCIVIQLSRFFLFSQGLFLRYPPPVILFVCHVAPSALPSCGLNLPTQYFPLYRDEMSLPMTVLANHPSCGRSTAPNTQSKCDHPTYYHLHKSRPHLMKNIFCTASCQGKKVRKLQKLTIHTNQLQKQQQEPVCHGRNTSWTTLSS